MEWRSFAKLSRREPQNYSFKNYKSTKNKVSQTLSSVINSGIVLKVVLKVVDMKNNSIILKKADVILELVNKIHYGINKGKKPVEIVVFIQ